MPTWEETVAFLTNHDVIEVEKADASAVVLHFGGTEGTDLSGKQLRLSRCQDFNNDDWMHVDTMLGRTEHVELEALIKEASTFFCGGVCGDGQFVTFRYSLPLRGLAPELLEIVLVAIAQAGEELQQRFASRLEKGFEW